MKNENKKRSPLKSFPLRQAGQSLDEKIEDMINDKIFLYVTYIILFIFLALTEWLKWYFNTPPQPLFWTLVAVVISIYSIKKILKYKKEVKNYQLGRDGEKIVGESLEKLREKGYKVFHDIIGGGFNIDHVLVGPGGVFSVETKTISKKGNQTISYDGVHLKIDGFALDRDPIAQARGQMYWLEKYISENAKMQIKVKPVVIFPGWYIDQKTNNTEVWVLNENSFPKYLDNEKPILSVEQINIIASRIESFNRG